MGGRVDRWLPVLISAAVAATLAVAGISAAHSGWSRPGPAGRPAASPG